MPTKFRWNINPKSIHISKPEGLIIFSVGILVVLLLYFILQVFFSDTVRRYSIREHSFIYLDQQQWFARQGFPGDVTGSFSTSDPNIKQISGLPIDLNTIFNIPVGGKPNTFSLMTRFDMPEDLIGQPLVITLAEIGENWAVYLNGQLVREEIFLNPDGSINIYRSVQEPMIFLPDSIIQAKGNILLIKIIGNPPATPYFSGDLPGLSMKTGSLLGSVEDITRMKTKSTAISFFQIGIYSFWGLFMVMFYIRRKEIYTLLFGSFLFVFAGYAFFSSSMIFENLINTEIITRMMNCDIIICVPIIGMCFRNYLWPERPISIAFLLMSLVCLAGVILMIILPYPLVGTVFRLYIFGLTLMVLYIFFQISSAVRNGIIGAKNIFIAAIIILLIAVYSVLDTVYLRSGFNLLTWTPLCLAVVFAVIFTERYWEMGVELVDKDLQLQRNTNQLEEIVARRTEELTDTKSELEKQLKEINSLQTILHEQVMRDPLTNLYNRRYMEEMMVKEFARADRKDYPLSLVMFDIDHFKLLNDTYSHAAGDRVLQLLGRIFITNIRIDDYAIRYGGEEFLIVFPQTPYSKALIRANQIREMVRQVSIEYNGIQLKVTISGGVAGFPDHGRKPEDILVHADSAMYKAKKLGRDRVEVYMNDFEQISEESGHP